MDTYFSLSAYLDIYWLRVKIGEYKSDGHWQELARKALVDDLYDVLRRLTAEVMRTTPDTGDPQQRIAAWHEQNRAAVERYLRVPQDLKAAEHLDLAMFSVSVRELQNLYQACAAT
jgi:glutamate dehydrogenase